MKYRSVISLAIVLFFTSISSAEPTPFTLPSGKEIKIIGIGKTFYLNNKDKPALTLHYETNIDLDNKDLLRQEAEMIWPVFRRNVEKSEFKNAIIRPTTPPVKKALILNQTQSFNFYVSKNRNGTWDFISWSRNYQEEAKKKAIKCLEILSNDSKKLINILHYPENYNELQLNNEIKLVTKLFEFLQEKFGKINSYKLSNAKSEFNYFAFQTGSTEYWNKYPYFYSLIFEVNYEKKGKGYMEYRFSMIRDKFEVCSIFYGLSSQTPENLAEIKKLVEEINDRLKNI